jgi:CRP/FNR family transcriptional regulator, cyclic AMP receptor protein
LAYRLRNHPNAAVVQARDSKAGEYLRKQGDRAEVLYLIDSGQIALEILVPHQGPLQIETVGAGGGAWVLMPDRAILVTLRCSGSGGRVRAGPGGKRLREECDDRPAVGYWVLKQLTPLLEVRLQKMRLRILELNSHWSR